jgi:hypothetical protein
LYDVFYTPNSWHVRIPHGCWFSNGVTISNLRCHDETKGLLWARTQGCATRHAQVSRIASHDPLWSYTDVLSFCELFLGYLSLSCLKIFIPNPDVSFIRIWNLDSWIQPLWHAYIIRQQPSNTVNTHWLLITADASSASL